MTEPNGGPDLNPEFKRILIPTLLPSKFPSDNPGTIYEIRDQLSEMSGQCHSFVCAISLFETTQSINHNDLIGEWAFIAARSGAMSLRNYAVALSKLRALIGNAPELMGKIDISKWKDVEKSFKSAFPFVHKMRHSVAHPEFYSNASKEMGLQIDGNFDQFGITMENSTTVLQINNSLFNSTFHATFEGALVHYDLTSESARTVIDLTKRIFSEIP